MCVPMFAIKEETVGPTLVADKITPKRGLRVPKMGSINIWICCTYFGTHTLSLLVVHWFSSLDCYKVPPTPAKGESLSQTILT